MNFEMLFEEKPLGPEVPLLSSASTPQIKKAQSLPQEHDCDPS